jgi:pilus assembly protein Flp/PilA
MQTSLWNLYIKMRNLVREDDGQDLIEYALVVALIAFAATAGMNSVASSINNAFSNLALTLNSYSG